MFYWRIFFFFSFFLWWVGSPNGFFWLSFSVSAFATKLDFGREFCCLKIKLFPHSDRYYPKSFMYGHQFYLCNQDELKPWLTNCCMSLLCFNIKICVQSRRFISFFFPARANISYLKRQKFCQFHRSSSFFSGRNVLKLRSGES